MNNGSSGEPQPHFEIPAAPQQGGELNSDQALERTAPSENAVGRQAPPPVSAAPPPPPATAPLPDSAGVPAPQTPPPVQSATNATAGHGHVIERQWVDKAKAIVAQTQDDPFIQKSEMSKVKAEYIQKRFNKTLPTDDTVPA